MVGGLCVLLLTVCTSARAQNASASRSLLVDGASAFTWSQGRFNILQVSGNVTVRLDSMTLTADGAVIWLSDLSNGGVSEQQQADIAPWAMPRSCSPRWA